MNGDYPGVFPRFTSIRVLRVLDLLRQLQQFQQQSLAQQRALQEKQLQVLLAFAWRSEFWKQRLHDAGLSPDRMVPYDHLQRIQPLTRHDLQEHFADLHTYPTDQPDSRVVSFTTSGSTGEPVTVERYAEVYQPLYDAVMLLEQSWHQFDLSQRMALFRHDCPDADDVPYGWPLSLLGSGKNNYSRGIGRHETDALFQTLFDKRPEVLSCSPTLVKIFCEMASNRENAVGLKRIHTLGEAVDMSFRKRVEQTFGARVIDRYSCGEAGYLALQCPKHDHYHVLGSHVLLEILDEQGAPCAIGQPGQVVVTALQSYAMPLIRYELGDIAEWGPPCDCGIQLPVISKILGKTRNYVLLPSGNKHFVTLGGDFGHDIGSLLGRQVNFYEGGIIEMKYRSSEVLTDAQLQSLVRQLRLRFGHPWPVELIRVDELNWSSVWKRAEFTKLPGLPLQKAISTR